MSAFTALAPRCQGGAGAALDVPHGVIWADEHSLCKLYGNLCAPYSDHSAGMGPLDSDYSSEDSRSSLGSCLLGGGLPLTWQASGACLHILTIQGAYIHGEGW